MWPGPARLQAYARDARKEYTELGSKDLSELKSFVKGLPKLLLLDRLSDLAVPVAEVVKQQVSPRQQMSAEGLWVKRPALPQGVAVDWPDCAATCCAVLL